MSGGSLFQVEWAIAACSWTLAEDTGSGFTSRGTVTLAAGTRTTTGHLAALVTALNAAVGAVGSYVLEPWTDAPTGERGCQRFAIRAAFTGAITWRLTAGAGADRVKLGLSATTITSTDKTVAPANWIYGIWAPPLYSFYEDRPRKKHRQSYTQTANLAPLIIRHTSRTLRDFSFQYVPGRFVDGADSPDSDAAQSGTYGTFQDLWDAFSLAQTVYYWPDYDDASEPDTGDAVALAMESADQAAGFLDCVDPSAFAEFGRAAYHVKFMAFEVSS